MDEKYEALLLVCLALEPLACTPSRAKHSVSRARACVRAMAILVLSPCSLFSERHSPGGTGGGGGSGGGGGGAGRQKAHDEHLHQVQCTAACLGWHMAVHRRLGVSPVWAEGQVAGRSNICAGRHALDGQEAREVIRAEMACAGRAPYQCKPYETRLN